MLSHPSIIKILEENQTEPINKICIFFFHQDTKNKLSFLLEFLKEKLKSISIELFDIDSNSVNKLSDFNIFIYKSIDEANDLSSHDKVKMKPHLFFLDGVQENSQKEDVIFYAIQNFVDIVNSNLLLVAERYLAKRTLIESGDLTGLVNNCFHCIKFKGLICDDQGTCRYTRIARPKLKPYLPTLECKIHITGFELKNLSMPNTKDNITGFNKAIYDSINNLFFHPLRSIIPDNIKGYESASLTNTTEYIKILQKSLSSIRQKNISFLTTDSTFLKYEDNAWKNPYMLRILAVSWRKINGNKINLIVSRLFIIDFQSYELSFIAKRFIPFFIINHILGIKVYVVSKKALLVEMQPSDLNFYIKSRLKVIGNGNIDIVGSDSLGILDTKFPYIRIFEKSLGPLHEGYITYVEKCLNNTVLSNEPINKSLYSLFEFKNLEEDIKKDLNNEIIEQITFSRDYYTELINLNESKLKIVENKLKDYDT